MLSFSLKPFYRSDAADNRASMVAAVTAGSAAAIRERTTATWVAPAAIVGGMLSRSKPPIAKKGIVARAAANRTYS